MENHLLNNKLLFLQPFLLTITYYLLVFRVNFSINGGEYEFLLSELFFLIFIVIIFQLIFYVLMRRFIKNKNIMMICEILLLALFFVRSIPTILLFVFMMIFAFVYKNKFMSLNAFLEVFCTVFFLFTVILGGLQVVWIAYSEISFLSRSYSYQKKKKVVVDNNEDIPNIYWFHMDGMPNNSFINTYYDQSLEDFSSFLNQKKFLSNRNASFVGGHHTQLALVSLYNPDYYDNFLKKYLNELDYCSLHHCKTKNTIMFQELIFKRLENEFLEAIQKKYTTFSITEFNQYTSFPTDYVYDITEMDGVCKVPFFKNDYSNQKIYQDILKKHMNTFTDYYFHFSNQNDSLFQENLDCNVDLSRYQTLDDSTFYPIRKTIRALEDARSKGNQPKFYFIDNILVHKYWNYDSNGKFIRKNNTDLDDFDDCYYYTTKVLMNFVQYIEDNDSNSVIVIQGDHGIHVLDENILKKYFHINHKQVMDIRNSTINAVYIPQKYQNGEEKYLENPLNISRYLINRFIGNNYEYLD